MNRSPQRPLKVGIFLPFGEYMMGGQTPRWTDLMTLAQRAKEIKLVLLTSCVSNRRLQ